MPITSGFTYSCSDSAIGGISDLWIANASELTSVAFTGEVITGINMQSNKVFYKITFEDDGCSFTEAVEVTNNRVLYKPEYKVKIGHRTAAARAFINALKGCERFVVAHKERATGVNWMTGYLLTQGLRLVSAAQQTGNTIADENMIELTIGHPVGVQNPAATVSATIPV